MSSVFQRRASMGLELLLCLLALAVLYALALPLGDAGVALGRNRVLAADSVSARQAGWLMAHVGQAMAVFVLAGWGVLAMARQAIPGTGFICAAVALWSLAWGWLAGQPADFLLFDVAGLNGWWVLSAASLCVWPLLTRWQRWCCPVDLAPARKERVSAFIYPGFVFLSGLGVLWLLDYAARGPGDLHLLGLRQFKSWVGALMVLSLVAGIGPALLRQTARWLARAGAPSGVRWQGRYAFITFAVVLLWYATVAGLGFMHHRQGVNQVGLVAVFTPAITSELLRLPVFVLGGWVMYRWLGQGVGLRLLAACAALAVLLTGTLLLTGDNGPVLVLAYTVSVLACSALVLHGFGGVTGRQTGGARVFSPVRVALSMGLVLIAVATIHAALIHLAAPHLNSLGARVQAMNTLANLPVAVRLTQELGEAPSVFALDFLIRLHWFMQSAPWNGYGLGAVPWCGHLGNLGAACDGLPRQAHSDYTFALLLGAWGALGAMGIVSLLLLWLWAMLPQARLQSRDSAVNPEAFGRWVLTLFVFSMVVQLAVSLMGTLAITPMTGVTLPLLSYGQSSLWVCAFFAGLVLHCTTRD